MSVLHLLVGYEEPTLRRTSGAEYEEYCRRILRWWPTPLSARAGAR
jgi:protein-S-isoprenylcysteine O-methyltransferase Ste14